MPVCTGLVLIGLVNENYLIVNKNLKFLIFQPDMVVHAHDLRSLRLWGRRIGNLILAWATELT